MNIQEKIVQYRNNIEDWEYVEAILNATDIQTLLASIAQMLQSGNGTYIREANFFLRDVVLLAPKHVNEEFRSNFSQQEIIDAMNDNVFANNFFVRSDTVDTIGRLGFTSSIPTLVKAFHQSIQNDPLLLFDIFDVLRTLQGKADWELLKKALDSSQFLTRWATLQILGHYFLIPDQVQEFLLKKTYLEILLADINDWIKQEARYQYERLLYLQKAQGLSRNEKKKLGRGLHQYEPSVDFSEIGIGFKNYLSQSNQADYQMLELEDFVDKLLVPSRKRA